ncbi:DnaD domain protein [Lactobacillus sp. S2-2]|uniref:DnaD domain protein n=1 Tax=Lactobacillus sp. S2-2 TaxID=2692917 RepID=UPI001F250DA5|nr:DnaD domain protein [Lactobacillus sp. S2-2]MCF6515070.1 DnaD domain protein [Lactobacillus sp. S2-2]
MEESEIIRLQNQYGNTVISNILLTNYHKIGMTNNELVVFLEIIYLKNKGISMPLPKDISTLTGMKEDQISNILHDLIEKKLIKIETENYNDSFNLDLTFIKLLKKINSKSQQEVNTTDDQYSDNLNDRKSVFKSIESEFGRNLSQIEIETINQWIDIDQYNYDLIQLALRESVLNQVYNLKYMDRILLNWSKRNITSPQQVDEMKRKNNISQQKENEIIDIPITRLDE